MKNYTLYQLKCRCSWRMKKEGKAVKIYEDPVIRRCPNCHTRYIISRKKTKNGFIGIQKKS